MSLSAALEGKYASSIIDGNVDRDLRRNRSTRRRRGERRRRGRHGHGRAAVAFRNRGLKGHPRETASDYPIVWGGAFPTVCPDAAAERARTSTMRSRAQGEETLRRAAGRARAERQRSIGIDSRAIVALGTAKIVHNRDRKFSSGQPQSHAALREAARIPGNIWPTPISGGAPSAIRRRWGAAFAARFAVWRPCFAARRHCRPPRALEQDLEFMQRSTRRRCASSSTTTTSSIAKSTWCRCWKCLRNSGCRGGVSRDPMRWSNLSEQSWSLVRKSRLAHGLYRCGIAERLAAARYPQRHQHDQTLEAVEKCRSHGVIPELSFMLAPPRDPEGETEKTFEFIRTDQAAASRHRSDDLHLHAAAAATGRQESGLGAHGERASRLRRAIPWCFRARRTDGRNRNGWITGVTRMRPGCQRAAAAAHRGFHDRTGMPISRPSWISALLRGESPLCERWPRGAIDFNDTIIPGSCAFREKSSVIGIRDVMSL